MNKTLASEAQMELVVPCLLNFICCVGGSAGNLLVLLSYYLYKKMRTITNVYLCSLALVDLVVCLVIQPLYIVTLLNQMSQKEQHCYFQMVRKVMTWITLTVASGNLTAIMFDRYLRVSVPLRYPTLMTKKRCYMITAVFWIIGIMLGGLTLLTNPTVKTAIQCYVLFLIFGLIIPGYLRILVIAKTQSKKFAKQNNYLEELSRQYIFVDENNQHQQLPGNKPKWSDQFEATKTIVIVITLFIVCWTPLVIFPFYYRWVSFTLRSKLLLIFPWINTFALCSSSVNPFVYCWRTPPYKLSFQQILLKIYKSCTCSRNKP